MGLMRWHGPILLGTWPCAKIQIKRFHGLGQRLKMKKLPLGWAEENVHGPCVSTTFRNPPWALFRHTVLSPQASRGALSMWIAWNNPHLHDHSPESPTGIPHRPRIKWAGSAEKSSLLTISMATIGQDKRVKDWVFWTVGKSQSLRNTVT